MIIFERENDYSGDSILFTGDITPIISILIHDDMCSKYTALLEVNDVSLDIELTTYNHYGDLIGVMLEIIRGDESIYRSSFKCFSRTDIIRFHVRDINNTLSNINHYLRNGIR